jgi:DNA-binding response OmpR family regulator
MSIESFPWTKEVEHYKALVTDVNLKSSLSGWEVAEQIREMAAGFPIIYMTGASADQWTSPGVPDSILLRKPFAPTQLVFRMSHLIE